MSNAGDTWQVVLGSIGILMILFLVVPSGQRPAPHKPFEVQVVQCGSAQDCELVLRPFSRRGWRICSAAMMTNIGQTTRIFLEREVR